MVHRDFIDLPRRTASDKVLRDEAFNIAKYPKYDGYQRGLASMDDKKSVSIARSEILATWDKSASGGGFKNGNMPNQELAEQNTQTNY